MANARYIHGMTALPDLCVPGAGELKHNAGNKAGKARRMCVG